MVYLSKSSLFGAPHSSLARHMEQFGAPNSELEDTTACTGK